MAEIDLERHASNFSAAQIMEDHHSSPSHTQIGHEEKDVEGAPTRKGSVELMHAKMENSSTEGKDNEKEYTTVSWDGPNDPDNPKNWNFYYKVWYSVLTGILCLNSTFTSTAPNGIMTEMENYFGFSQEVATLTISLWVAGYCLGPLIWGPMSERVGRLPVFYISIFMYTIWNIACALAKNTGSILVFRFLGGTFGSAPLTNSGACLADLWDPRYRGVALTLFTLAPFAGPALGPIVSGAVSVSGADWRWTYWACAMFSGVCLFLVVVTLKESYEPVILTRKARRIRKETGMDTVRSRLELDPIILKQFLHRTLLFPFIMLIQEPILLVLGLYMSYIYGIIYLSFGAWPIIFQEVHEFNNLIGGVIFLNIFTGGISGVLLYVVYFNPRYVKYVKEYEEEGKGKVPPEVRLHGLMVAAPCLVISLFWLGWTGYKESISFVSPLFAGGLLGFSILIVFLTLFNYIIDAYTVKAASALAGNTVMRSFFGAGFPLFTVQMFHKLGIQWAGSLLAFLALIMVPIPFVLIKFGPRIRKLSKNAA